MVDKSQRFIGWLPASEPAAHALAISELEVYRPSGKRQKLHNAGEASAIPRPRPREAASGLTCGVGASLENTRLAESV